MQEYPREFVFRVIYQLCGSSLAVTYEVENRDSRTLYLGLGGHPGFNVPLAGGKRLEDYRLRFSERCAPRRVGFTEDCFVSGGLDPFPPLALSSCKGGGDHGDGGTVPSDPCGAGDRVHFL